MNKIAQYLNEHIVGEVSSLRAVRRRFSQDASVLTITPEIVVFPKVTNDIRKVARFAWQLAEKGHVMGMTVRGAGTDTTGAAIGKGIVINTSAHLTDILFVGPKERLVHVQPGAMVKTVNDVLHWHGLTLKNAEFSGPETVGGILAGNTLGERGSIAESIQKLEVILANGDVIETGRIPRREVDKKKGLQTLEGEIYRQIDGILEDNESVVQSLAKDQTPDNTAFRSIIRVKDKDGSMNLTPLFIGSQGTLGIISEVVLKTEFYSKFQTIVVAAIPSRELARDIVDGLKSLEPAILEMIDGELFAEAQEKGKKYAIFGDTADLVGSGAVIFMSFKDFSDRAQAHKLKKAAKLLTKKEVSFVTSENESIEDMIALRQVASVVAQSLNDSESLPPVIDGAYIPTGRHEEFSSALQELATKIHVELPIKTNMLTGIITVYPLLHLGEVSDKQKVFKLMNEYSALVDRCGGNFISDGGEGRLKANAAWALLDDQTKLMYDQIRQAFDPFNTLNPGVKQKNDVKHLVEALRPTYDQADLIDRGFNR
jgi:FAD/FMN-containing dehydrogenase